MSHCYVGHVHSHKARDCGTLPVCGLYGYSGLIFAVHETKGVFSSPGETAGCRGWVSATGSGLTVNARNKFCDSVAFPERGSETGYQNDPLSSPHPLCHSRNLESVPCHQHGVLQLLMNNGTAQGTELEGYLWVTEIYPDPDDTHRVISIYSFGLQVILVTEPSHSQRPRDSRHYRSDKSYLSGCLHSFYGTARIHARPLVVTENWNGTLYQGQGILDWQYTYPSAAQNALDQMTPFENPYHP